MYSPVNKRLLFINVMLHNVIVQWNKMIWFYGPWTILFHYPIRELVSDSCFCGITTLNTALKTTLIIRYTTFNIDLHHFIRPLYTTLNMYFTPLFMPTFHHFSCPLFTTFHAHFTPFFMPTLLHFSCPL